jgi:uncharacterized protein YxeA
MKKILLIILALIAIPTFAYDIDYCIQTNQSDYWACFQQQEDYKNKTLDLLSWFSFAYKIDNDYIIKKCHQLNQVAYYFCVSNEISSNLILKK